MLAMSRKIKAKQGRDWKMRKYGGVGHDPSTGKTEKALPWFMYKQMLKDVAGAEGWGSILDDNKEEYVDATTRKVLIKDLARDGRKLQGLRIHPNNKEERRDLKRSIADGTKTLTTLDITAAKDNEKAQKVISLIKETVTTPVLNVLTPIELAKGHHKVQALDAFLAEGDRRYAGNAADRRTQLNEMMTAIGMAYTKDEMQLLVSEVQYVSDVAKIALFKRNPANTVSNRLKAEAEAFRSGGRAIYPPPRILVDSEVPTFTAREKLDSVLKRTDATTVSLGPYRELAVAEKSNDNPSFERFVEKFEERMGNDQS